MNKMLAHHVRKSHRSFPLGPITLSFALKTQTASESIAESRSEIGKQEITSTTFERHQPHVLPAVMALENSRDMALISHPNILFRSDIDCIPYDTSPDQTPPALMQMTACAPEKRTSVQNQFTPNGSGQDCVMHLIVNADCVTQLRHLVMETCGECVAFIRIQPMAHATRMKVWLGLSRPAAGRIMACVVDQLPEAEFGQIQSSK